jgi:translation initiation factor IF-1
VDFDREGSASQRKEVSGVVTDVLPSAMYRVRLDEGGHIVQAHIADRVDRNFVRVLVGDRVRVELTADVGRGRIVKKI